MMVPTRKDAWPAWFYYIGLIIELINELACIAVIIKIARRRKAGGRGGAVGMPHLIDDLVLLLACYHLFYDLIFGVGVYIAFLMPMDSPLGSKALGLFVWGIPFSWPPFFLHTYLASVCHNWLVLGYSIPRIKRGFRPAMCWIFVAFLIQAFFESIVFVVDKWIPFYTIAKWARFAAVERLIGMIITTGVTAYFYLRTCWTIVARFKARERVKRRHESVVRKFLIIFSIVIVTNGLWTAYLFLFYHHKVNSVMLGVFLLIPILPVPLYDCLVLGNLGQGWCQLLPCCGGSAKPSGEDHVPEQPPALAGGRRLASRNLSSVKYLNSFLGRSYRSGLRGGSSLVEQPAALFVSTFNMGPIKDVRGLGGPLGEWVPLGYDVYAIGLQECNCVEELRHALHEHLGGPSAYQMFQSEVAPATLLYGSIALTVFARASDVASGAFAAVGAETSAVRNGVNLVVGKAGNKGMTGLSFRFHDATLAFVTCHYASDSAGKKRLRQRNLDAHRTLREIRLTDDEGFHVAAQHHHTFVFGDLNYRMRLSAEQMVQRVAATARALESSVWQDEQASYFDDDNDDDGGDDGEDDEASLYDEDEESGLALSSRRESSGAASPFPSVAVGAASLSTQQKRSWVAEAYLSRLCRQDPRFASAAAAQQGGGGSSSVNNNSRVAFAGAGGSGAAQAVSTVSVPSGSALEPTQEETRDEDEENEEEQVSDGDETAGDGEEPLPAVEHSGVTSGAADSGAEHPEAAQPKAAAKPQGVRFGRLLPWFSGRSRSSADGETQITSSGDVFSSYSSSASSTSDAFLTYTTQSAAEGLWAWVAQHDELLLEMRAGHVFADFTEGPITFPPPFRWRRGGDAGNYTSTERLRGAYVLRKKGDGERIPSYTDRILFHSLPDVRAQLQLLAYQMCDSLRGSDHRPVSAAFRLAVNRERIGFHTGPTPGRSTPGPAPFISPEFAATASTWRVTLSKASYRPFRLKPSLALPALVPEASSAAPFAMGRQPSRPFRLRSRGTSILTTQTTQMPAAPVLPQPGWKVRVFFPCVLEDPYAEDIKVHVLEEALGDGLGGGRGGSGLMARSGSKSASGGGTSVDGSESVLTRSGTAGGSSSAVAGPGTTESLRRSHDFVWQDMRGVDGAAFSVLVQPDVSRHALLRLADEQGTEVGQGVICLRHAFASASTSASSNPATAESRRGRARFALPLFARKGGDGGGGEKGGVGEGVEVLLTNGGRAVASVRLQVKIRRHKN